MSFNPSELLIMLLVTFGAYMLIGAIWFIAKVVSAVLKVSSMAPSNYTGDFVGEVVNDFLSPFTDVRFGSDGNNVPDDCRKLDRWCKGKYGAGIASALIRIVVAWPKELCYVDMAIISSFAIARDLADRKAREVS